MMRRGVVVLALTAASLFFASRFNSPERILVPDVEGPTVVAVQQAVTTTETRVPISTAQTSTTSTTSTPPTTIAVPTEYSGGEVFEGTRIYTNWGWVKVEIKVVDGLMVDIELVMVPRNTKRSEALTLEHEPKLREQALEMQDPRVDGIAGATVISDGYRASLNGAMITAGLRAPSER